jgi:hypothetical protein
MADDIGMAAFSVFFMQSPSFLAHQRQFEDGRRKMGIAERLFPGNQVGGRARLQT